MVMAEIVAAFCAGLLLAAVNYFILWLTVKKLVTARRPAALALASFLSRTAFVVLGFYLATRGDPPGLAACVLGFLLARTIAARRAAPAGAGGRGPR